MELRTLGQSGLVVAPIGLGTVKLGRTRGLKYPAPVELPSDERAIELLRAARELGVNLIDTAPAYGISEERLGRLLPMAAPRRHWVVCTKAGEEFDDSTGVSRHDYSPGAIGASVRRSLACLRVEALDIVLLHFSSSCDDAGVLLAGEALGALRDLQRLGLVRAVGASTGTPAGGVLAADLCDVVMLTLNPAYDADVPAIDRARERGVGVLIKKALGSGHAGDPLASVRMVTRTPGVACAVLGTTNPEHLRASVACAV